MGAYERHETRLSPLQSGIPADIARNQEFGAIQPQSSDTKHVARWVWAVVVGVVLFALAALA